jgi:cellulose synthase/poly-beta-1,6-N-acetylglucosamine synthase-like glycosyltransferase
MIELVLNTAAVLCTAVAVLLCVPCAVVLLQALMAWRRPEDEYGNAAPPTSWPRLAVLMPAHNEAGGIAVSIDAIRAQLAARDRLLVIADNCTDDTARVAQAAGATVLVRSSLNLRGKGYALDHGVRALEADPPEVVIVIDADCQVHPNTLAHLAQACVSTMRPNQALNLMRSPPGAGLKVRIAEFAWNLKNHARPLGFSRLGLPCQLMGTGMGFPWEVIKSAQLASGHIVEDLKLGLELAAAGSPPKFCTQGLVTSMFPTSNEGMLAQRTRWEHGHLDVAVKLGPPMLWRALKAGRFGMASMVIDMCVPPLAALVMLILVTSLLGLVLAVLGHIGTLQIMTVGVFSLGAGVMLTWYRFGRAIVSLRDLMSVPVYIAAKVPLYLRAVTKRQVEWVRTKRDDASK